MNEASALEKFKDYLNQHSEELASIKEKRLVLDINQMRQFDKELSNFILNDPSSCIPWFEEEIRKTYEIPHVGFEGALGMNSVTPRTVNSSFIGKMLSIEGIVTSVSLVRPKLKKSVHYCEQDKQFCEKDYRDGTMITKLPPTNFIYPHKDSNGNPLSSEFGMSEYIDFQTITLQEMPENSQSGQVPRSIECILTEDLVDKVRPGDRIKAYGIYKSFCFGNLQFPNQFRTVLIVFNLQYIKGLDNFSPEDASKKIDTFRLLANSNMKFSAIAPTIYGHDDLKKAIALMMVGGNEVTMANGSRIRGDINILLVGDPSTAKSQILRYALNFLPLAIATTGRGSSGVGLTAAVVLDKETGEKRLEAGAMVLADRGLVCIDEFDKMNPLDRIAIHEVMEQQTVTIAKAGIHTTLNARCSVLAAANPILGSYNDKMSVQDNIKLPESLITRFDLIFITLDEYNAEKDDRISKHVLKMHISEERNESDISQMLFKEFIVYAKSLRPQLSREAGSLIASEYVKIRESKDSKNLIVNITPRLLETLIRLSTAFAKLRLSEVVEVEDAKEAIELLNNNLIKKVVKTSSHKKIKIENEEAESPITLARSLQTEAFEKIRNLIYEWKTNHCEEQFVDINDLANAIQLSVSDILSVVNELSEQGIIHLSGDHIFFLE